MVKKVVNIIVLFIVIVISLNAVTNKCYAMTDTEQNIAKYEIKKSEEEQFLNNINDTENETKRIKNITKKISESNYTTKEIYKTKTLDKKSEEYIYEQFGKTQEFKDNEYVGTLEIVDMEIQTINNGYYEKIDEKVLSFTNYSDNDLNNIEKEIELDNTKYYLINVKWEVETTKNIDGEEVPLTYKGNKIYQTIQKISYPYTYKVTVKYEGVVEHIDTIYDYFVEYEDVIKENEKDFVKPIIIISGIGFFVIILILANKKNTYVYSKVDKGFKLIKREKLNDKNLVIDISKCKHRSRDSIYAIKINNSAFKKLKGRTISLALGNRKKDIVLWNNYYEIKI